jgi:glutaredoxin
MTEKILFFSHPRCPYCPKAEEVLKEMGLQYEKISLDTSEGTRLAESYGIMVLPTIIIENGHGIEKISGYSSMLKEKIKKAFS